MRYFINHFSMIVSLVIALILSLCMATTAIFYDHLVFSPELLIRNWGTAFLTIMLVSIIMPVIGWGDQLAGLFGLKPRTPLFGLVSNLVPTFFYNTAATLVLVGVNVTFTAPFYWAAVAHDWPVMYVVSYFLSLGAVALGINLAKNSVGRAPAAPH
jgi:hypothetical protein